MRFVGGRDASTMRLLPWTGTGGKPCYVVGDGTGYVSRKADEVEDIQLDMADELLGHAADLLAEAEAEAEAPATAPQLHFLAGRLRESLEQVRRIAESRGSRLEAALAQPAPSQPPLAQPQSNSETSP
ncbi:hypothetical protein AMK21_01475 [Streptomyces sp. CB00316]|uniref:hypothetical protein n=1 Tax=unclassified Streptomyces TaxID=2593676 RepID=UPI00093EAE35|nr:MULTISPECIES: hypothetical protein [unclassified Streptomyces]MBT2377308.1 hypothetical protein [Streptomyces sp. ISL-111]OKJ23673.1 hypothetical protein AMK21_01475 [Streptomyces sp. CB00316]